MRYATQENMKKSKKYRDNSYVPEVLTGAAVAGLATAGLLKGRANTLDTLAEGAREGLSKGVGKAFKGSKAGKSLKPYMKSFKSGAGKSKRNFQDFDTFVAKYKDQNHYRAGHTFTPEQERRLYERFQREERILEGFAEKAEAKWRRANGVDPKAKLNKFYQNQLKDYMDDEWSSYVKSTPGASWLTAGNPSKKIGKPKNKGFSDSAIKGVGLGGAAGATSLAVHAVGEKYFDKQDDDKVRQIIRNSYSNGDNRGYRGPNQRAQYYNPRREQFQKRASYEDIIEAARKVEVPDGLRNAGEVAAGGAADAAIITGLPLAVKAATGIDVARGFKRVDKDDDDNIVIDVPLTSIRKKASIDVADVVDDAHEILTKDDAIRRFLAKRKDTAVRVLPWAAASGGVTAFANRNEKELPPLEQGNARITIQTRPTPEEPNSMLMRRASEESQRDDDISDDAQQLLEELRKSIAEASQDDVQRGLEQSVTYTPKSGETGKDYKFRKDS